MSRIGLAFSSFFRLIFGKRLHPDVERFLPDDLRAPAKALPAPVEARPSPPAAPRPEAAKPEAAKPEAAKPEAAKPEPAKPSKLPVEAAKPEPARPAATDDARRKVDPAAAQRDGALALLALLQRDGRLIDFLREPLDGFSDADIGAAARDVHRGCAKVLAQVFTLEAVLPGADDAKVTVPRGFDPTEIRIIGEAKGEPPFTGALRHHGWRAERAQLPSLADGVDRAIVAPAEVEV